MHSISASSSDFAWSAHDQRMDCMKGPTYQVHQNANSKDQLEKGWKDIKQKEGKDEAVEGVTGQSVKKNRKRWRGGGHESTQNLIPEAPRSIARKSAPVFLYPQRDCNSFSEEEEREKDQQPETDALKSTPPRKSHLFV